MDLNERTGFVLPLAMALTAVILGLATSSLMLERHRHALRQRAHLEQRLRGILRESVPSILQDLHTTLYSIPSASAQVPAREPGNASVNQVAISKSTGYKPLYSKSHDTATRRASFTSPVSGTSLQADYLLLSPAGEKPEFSIAWSAEDLSLRNTQPSPPEGWPLPGWTYSPIRADLKIPEEITSTAPFTYSWIPQQQPLPFSPSSSPALVPVVTSITLRFGIFASGSSGQREKVIRIRYYLEGTVWNPYNRELQMHTSNNLQPAFAVAWEGLPQVRIRNLTQGMVTSWIPLDEAVNSRTGATGINGWIRTPQIIAPGEHRPFVEPDAKYQPEGLARTLHHGFNVGPADHLIVEFKPGEDGISASCFPLSEPDPDQSGKHTWFSFRNVMLDIPAVEFDRADDDPHPFYLYGGSLDFRPGNCQFLVEINRPGIANSTAIDPRTRLIIPHNDPEHINGDSNVDYPVIKTLVTVRGNDFPDTLHPDHMTPLFSWPTRLPLSVLEHTDYPDWTQSFRLGSKGANQINGILDHPHVWPINGEIDRQVTVDSADGLQRGFRPAFNVNHLQHAGWMDLLHQSEFSASSGFARYASLSADETDSLVKIPQEELTHICMSLVSGIQSTPSTSVSDFFNRGLLSRHGDIETVDNLLPLRGFLRNAIPLSGHGSSWIIHLSALVRYDQAQFTRQARVWLQEIIEEGNSPSLHILRFEWVTEHMNKVP